MSAAHHDDRASRRADHAQRARYARRYAGNDAQYDALADAERQVVSVSDPDTSGRRTVVVRDMETEQELTWSTDGAGDLQIGAGTWLKLGGVTTHTAKRRVARHLARI
jgi:hypothetical protein